MDLRRFWMTWRRDIMRGAGLFAVVLIAGLTISSVAGRVRRGFTFNFDGLNAPELAGRGAPGDTAAVWTWTGKVAPKQSVWLKNVNGDVAVARASAPVKVQTVNGEIDAQTSAGPLEAKNVNGSVHAAISGFAEPGKVEVKTVNGAVTLELPAQLNAELEATTLAGSVDTDFPLTASQGILPRRFHGTIGTGGRHRQLVE